ARSQPASEPRKVRREFAGIWAQRLAGGANCRVTRQQIFARRDDKCGTLNGNAGPSRMPACIEGHNVNLTFRPPNRAPVRALHSFDIDVREGEFLSIVGPSGCGKSTFLNVVLGLLQPDSGDLRIRGRPIAGPGTDRAMVFQEFGLLPWRTVLNNIELGL